MSEELNFNVKMINMTLLEDDYEHINSLWKDGHNSKVRLIRLYALSEWIFLYGQC